MRGAVVEHDDELRQVPAHAFCVFHTQVYSPSRLNFTGAAAPAVRVLPAPSGGKKPLKSWMTVSVTGTSAVPPAAPAMHSLPVYVPKPRPVELKVTAVGSVACASVVPAAGETLTHDRSDGTLQSLTASVIVQFRSSASAAVSFVICSSCGAAEAFGISVASSAAGATAIPGWQIGGMSNASTLSAFVLTLPCDALNPRPRLAKPRQSAQVFAPPVSA